MTSGMTSSSVRAVSRACPRVIEYVVKMAND
jgi:hypothetical protein